MASECCDLLCLDLPVAEGIRAAMPTSEAATRLAGLAQACADPTRLTMLLALAAADELCVCDLTWIVGRSQALASHHLRKLREADLVQTRRDAKIVYYSLTDTGRRVAGLLGTVTAAPTT